MCKRARPARGLRVALAAAIVTMALSACGTGASRPTNGTVRVVATENFWGSIASQLGGTHASVHSIIVNPAQDPHSYEPTAADARALATAQLVIVNGVGYDPWAAQLLNANPVPGRVVLSVGDLLRLTDSDNPHRWYFPGDVHAVARAISRELSRLDPSQRAYFTHQHVRFESAELAAYRDLIATIRTRFDGVPVGASENVLAGLASALGLRLITPASFMNATGEGTEVSAQDTATAERQITEHRIKVWVYNSQNATPEVQLLTGLARSNHIPVSTVTETLSPSGENFERWQVAQLRELEHALHSATGR